jgi:hypothetical protein
VRLGFTVGVPIGNERRFLARLNLHSGHPFVPYRWCRRWWSWGFHLLPVASYRPPQRPPAPLPAARQAAMRKAGALMVVGLHGLRPSSLPTGWNPGLPATGLDGQIRSGTQQSWTAAQPLERSDGASDHHAQAGAPPRQRCRPPTSTREERAQRSALDARHGRRVVGSSSNRIREGPNGATRTSARSSSLRSAP